MKNKILIIGPAWVGDMVMAQCLFKLLKQKNPAVEIDVLAPAWSEPLLARMPEVNQSFVMPLGHGVIDLKTRYTIGKNLRAQRYDQAIVLPNSFKSALIPFFARIPKRTGWLGEMRYGVLNDIRYLDKKRYPLMIERFMALGLNKGEVLSEPYPIPELRYQVSSDKRPILALCPGAEFGPAKRWPEDYYADVANAKLKEGWEVWLLGSQKDAVVTERIMALTDKRCVDFAGRTQLNEAVDLLAQATLVISNDSGLMHIAAALHKPLIALYGPTSASFTPPLHEKAKIINLSLKCQPCFQRDCPLTHHRCMRELTPNIVLHEMNAL
jgi:heptosyltransferase-2